MPQSYEIHLGRHRAVSLRSLFRTSLTFLAFLIASCGTNIMALKEEVKDSFSVIKVGPLCGLEMIEGVHVKGGQRIFHVKPGPKKLVFSYPGEMIGDMFYYTDEPVEIYLDLKPGHTYEASGEPSYPAMFRIKVWDKDGKETFFSDPVELKIKWLLRVEYIRDF